MDWKEPLLESLIRHGFDAW